MVKFWCIFRLRQKFSLLLLLLLAVVAGRVSSSELPWVPELKEGSWVRYALTLPVGNPLHGKELSCMIKVMAVDGRRVSLEYIFEGLENSSDSDSTLLINDDNFDPVRVLGLDTGDYQPSPSTPVKFKVKALGKEVDAQKLVTASSVDKGLPSMEVIRSREIPFGLVRASGSGVTIEAVNYSWGDGVRPGNARVE